MTKLKWKKWQKMNHKIIYRPRALLQKREKTYAKFQKDRVKIVWEVAIIRSTVYTSEDRKWQSSKSRKKSDKNKGKDYMKNKKCTFLD